MPKYTTKPFNLEMARKGHPVVTLSGRDVRVLKDTRVSPDGRTVVALVQSIDREVGEHLRSFTEDGECSKPSYKLFMKVAKVDGWINIHLNDKLRVQIHDTESSAISKVGTEMYRHNMYQMVRR